MTPITWQWAYVNVDEAKAIRHVRTAAGARRYNLPIGSPIPGGSVGRVAPKPSAGRALKGSEKRVSTPVGALKPGDSVVTHGAGVGRAVRAVGPGAGEVRKVKSVEDGEAQFGPSGAGKTVVRFEDGSFSTPSVGSWDVAHDSGSTDKPVKPAPEKPTETAKKPESGLSKPVEEPKKDRKVEVRVSSYSDSITELVVDGEVIKTFQDPKHYIAQGVANDPKLLDKVIAEQHRKKLVARWVKEQPDMTLQEWLDSDGGKTKDKPDAGLTTGGGAGQTTDMNETPTAVAAATAARDAHIAAVRDMEARYDAASKAADALPDGDPGIRAAVKEVRALRAQIKEMEQETAKLTAAISTARRASTGGVVTTPPEFTDGTRSLTRSETNAVRKAAAAIRTRLDKEMRTLDNEARLVQLNGGDVKPLKARYNAMREEEAHLYQMMTQINTEDFDTGLSTRKFTRAQVDAMLSGRFADFNKPDSGLTTPDGGGNTRDMNTTSPLPTGTRTGITKLTEGMTITAHAAEDGKRSVVYRDRANHTETVTIASIARAKGQSYTARGTTSHYYTLTFTDGTVSSQLPHANSVNVV